METHTLSIRGMESNHCLVTVKNIIGSHEGAELESISIGNAAIRVDETKTSKEAVIAKIEKMGYRVEEAAAKTTEVLKFKTNIKCSGCVAAVSPFLNDVAGQNKWKVDTGNPDKVLTVMADSTSSPGAILKAIEKAGYQALQLN